MVKLKRLDKVAWLRVVEAFIGIIVIAIVLLIVVNKGDVIKSNSDEVHEMQDNILEIISKNDSLRNIVLNIDPTATNAWDNPKINSAIKKLAPRSWNYSTRVCLLESACGGKNIPNTDIYVTERIFISNLTKYTPRKLRFFVWTLD